MSKTPATNRQSLTNNLKIAIVCDWLTGVGGAERVVLELHRMFPDAPIYTSQYDPDKIDWFTSADVRTGWLQKLPIGLKKFLPLPRAWYFSRLDLSEYDLIISNNFGAESKAVKFSTQTTHLCICNAPTHYYWSRYNDYIKNPGFGIFNWLARLGLRLLVTPMRLWDYKAAQKPTHMIAISTHIQNEIKKYYNRDSVIIHPPVDTQRFLLPTPYSPLPTPPRRGFVITGRQTPYKRVDLAVATCTRLNLPLTVIGNGPEHAKLVKMAGNTIQFITNATDQDVAHHLASAEAFIFPNLDDFGIAPVEALAAGTPVLAYKAGGALDYVIPGKTGEFFEKQSINSLATCLNNFNPANYSSDDIKSVAQQFDNTVFQKNLRQELARVLQ